MSDPTKVQDVFGNYLKLRERIDREADAMDRVDNSADPRTDRAIAADHIGTDPYMPSPAPVHGPAPDGKYEAKFEPTQGKYYTTGGRWLDDYPDDYSGDVRMETMEERTARLSKIEPLMPPPNYGNRDFVRDACANAPPPMDDVGGHDVEFDQAEGYTIKGDELLKTRAATHGEFADNARIAQHLRDMFRAEDGWKTLTPIMREALEMIAGKTARILSGHGMFADHWMDIAGYATLVTERLP